MPLLYQRATVQRVGKHLLLLSGGTPGGVAGWQWDAVLNAGSLNTLKGFTGQYNDSLTGLDYYNARYYDPVAGVFLAADTVQGNAQGLNPYGYVNGNPETRSDPSGRIPIGPGGQRYYPSVPPPSLDPAPAAPPAPTPQAIPHLPPPPPTSNSASPRQIALGLAQWTEFYRAILGDQTKRNYAAGAWYITDSAGNFLTNPIMMSKLPARSWGNSGENHSEYLLLLAWATSAVADEALGILNSELHAGVKAVLHMVIFTQWPACEGWCTPFFSAVLSHLAAQLEPLLNVEPVPFFLVPTRIMDISVFSASSPRNSPTPAFVNSISDLSENFYEEDDAQTIINFY